MSIIYLSSPTAGEQQATHLEYVDRLWLILNVIAISRLLN